MPTRLLGLGTSRLKVYAGDGVLGVIIGYD
jgi:hypothetical protein